jgi:hypothetical protein
MEVMLDEKAEEKERSRLKGPRMRDGKEWGVNYCS